MTGNAPDRRRDDLARRAAAEWLLADALRELGKRHENATRWKPGANPDAEPPPRVDFGPSEHGKPPGTGPDALRASEHLRSRLELAGVPTEAALAAIERYMYPANFVGTVRPAGKPLARAWERLDCPEGRKALWARLLDPKWPTADRLAEWLAYVLPAGPTDDWQRSDAPPDHAGACYDFAHILGMIRDEWREADRERWKLLGIGMDPASKAYEIGVRQHLAEADRLIHKLRSDLLPYLLPKCDPALRERLLSVVAALDLDRWRTLPNGEETQRWRQQWEAIGLDDEIADLVALLRAEYEAAPSGAPPGAPAFVPTEAQRNMMQAIGEAGTLIHQATIAADSGEELRTIKREMIVLEKAGLVIRPRGPNSGYALTEDGKRVLSQLGTK